MSNITTTEKTQKKWWRELGVGQKTLEIMANNVGKELIVFDTETTGLSPELNHVIQLSAIKTVIDENLEFHEIGRLDTYINPGYKLPKKIIEITGITDEKLAGYPDEKTQWNSIYAFFGDNPIICGHNSPFDIGMMNAMYQRNIGQPFEPIALDTLRMAQELHHRTEAGSHKLGDLAEHFGVDYGLTFHNSMDDVIATTRLLRFFIEEYVDKREHANEEPTKIPTRIKSCWHWEGMIGKKGGGREMALRLYVRVKHEDRVLWFSQRRPYDWGEKDKGSVEMFDMEDIEKQVLKLYGCETLEELSKVRDSKYARF